MKKKRIYRWFAAILVGAILSTSIPSAFVESVYAAAEEKQNDSRQNIWYEGSAKINAS